MGYIFSGGTPANGIFKSVDDGVTWTSLGGFPNTNAGRISLGITSSGGDVIYATVENYNTSQAARHLEEQATAAA